MDLSFLAPQGRKPNLVAPQVNKHSLTNSYWLDDQCIAKVIGLITLKTIENYQEFEEHSTPAQHNPGNVGGISDAF